MAVSHGRPCLYDAQVRQSLLIDRPHKASKGKACALQQATRSIDSPEKHASQLLCRPGSAARSGCQHQIPNSDHQM